MFGRFLILVCSLLMTISTSLCLKAEEINAAQPRQKRFHHSGHNSGHHGGHHGHHHHGHYHHHGHLYPSPLIGQQLSYPAYDYDYGRRCCIRPFNGCPSPLCSWFGVQYFDESRQCCYRKFSGCNYPTCPSSDESSIYDTGRDCCRRAAVGCHTPLCSAPAVEYYDEYRHCCYKRVPGCYHRPLCSQSLSSYDSGHDCCRRRTAGCQRPLCCRSRRCRRQLRCDALLAFHFLFGHFAKSFTMDMSRNCALITLFLSSVGSLDLESDKSGTSRISPALPGPAVGSQAQTFLERLWEDLIRPRTTTIKPETTSQINATAFNETAGGNFTHKANWTTGSELRMSMVIGYDAYHDSANKTVSVEAAVFSIDAKMTRWFSRCALHTDPNQLATNLTEFCRQGLQKFYETKGNFPDKVFLYRDGVGEGHIPVVFKEELPRIQKAFNEINANIKLCFIIVTKRVTLRFFQEKQGVFVNPPPGTLVDSGITKPERYDFYMVPQAVRQGTVTPVSYNVIFDNTGLQPDHLHRLSYKLCHLYYNWQGTIRVPAPCQYAHKLAFLVAQSLHKPVHESLADKLVFL